MKLLRNLAGFFVLSTLICVAPAFAWRGHRLVVVTNATNNTITVFYASTSDASAWDTTNNLLNGQSVEPGQQITISIPWTGYHQCWYDLMAVFSGTDQHAYDYSVNVCGGGAWTVSSSS